MIRLANLADANQLFALNEKFNGKDVVSFDTLKDKLNRGGGEIVVVCEEAGVITGFVCAQIFQSFCYNANYAEITEVYVDKAYRRLGYATQMIEFIQSYCEENFNVSNFQLFTGKSNKKAQKLYKSLGYRRDGALLLRKQNKKLQQNN